MQRRAHPPTILWGTQSIIFIYIYILNPLTFNPPPSAPTLFLRCLLARSVTGTGKVEMYAGECGGREGRGPDTRRQIEGERRRLSEGREALSSPPLPPPSG